MPTPLDMLLHINMSTHKITVEYLAFARVVSDTQDSIVCLDIEIDDYIRKYFCDSASTLVWSTRVLSYKPTVKLTADTSNIRCNMSRSNLSSIIRVNMNKGAKIRCNISFNLECKLFVESDIVNISNVDAVNIQGAW